MSEESDLTSHHSYYDREVLEQMSSSSGSSSEQMSFQPGSSVNDKVKRSKYQKYSKIAVHHNKTVSHDFHDQKNNKVAQQHNRHVSQDWSEKKLLQNHLRNVSQDWNEFK